MKNIVLIGIMGCGKTTICSLLSKKLKREMIDMDTYLENKYQTSIPDMFSISEDYFRDKETEVCQDMSHISDKIISTGGGVIKRKENIDYLKQNSVIFYIDRPIENIVNDVETSHRPLLKNGPDKLYQLDQERRALYLSSCDYHIMNDKTLDEVVEEIISLI